MPGTHFAATALTEYWSAVRTNLILGPSCLRESNAEERARFSTRPLPSPWDEPGAEREALAAYDRVHARLLTDLAARLDRVHGVERGERGWRIIAGPWLMAYLTTLCDRLLVARAALKAAPDATFCAPPPRRPARDTGEYLGWLTTDAFNQGLYGEIFRFLGRPVEDREAAEVPAARIRPAWKIQASRAGRAAALLARSARPPDTAFSSLYMPAADQAALCLRSGLRVQPTFGRLAAPRLADAADPRRASFGTADDAADELERLARALMPSHLPSILLEGYGAAAAEVRGEWPRPPKAALTSVGWCLDEHFKILAADVVSRGGRLTIAQHGGAYGMFEILHNERHERAIADHYWTWGWTEPSSPGQPARVAPIPHGRLSRGARRGGAEGWLMIAHALPRFGYTFYFCNVPAWHRYPEYLEQRERFVAALSDESRGRLSVRLPVEDFGWDMRPRLERRWPGLRLEGAEAPMLRRAASARLVVIDHPQTSWLECLAADIPTLLFWDPALWRMREGARGALDSLRAAGVLCDSPEEAARRAEKILPDPEGWWNEPAVRRAVETFRAGWALGSSDWAARWAAGADAAAREASS